jgi:hypothetical protein
MAYTYEQFANGYSTTLASGYTAGSGSITVTSASGAPSAGNFRLAILNTALTAVKVLLKVTAVSGTTFTVTAEGSDASALSGDPVYGTEWTAAAITALMQDYHQSDTDANLPTASRAGVLYLPTNSGRIYRDTGAAWTQWGPLYGSLTPPLMADMTWVNQTSGAVTASGTDTSTGLLLTSAPVASDNARLLVKALPGSGAYTLTVGLLMHSWSENFIAVGMCLYEAGSTKVRFFGCNSGQWRLMHQASPTGSGTFDLSSDKAPTHGLIWLRIVDDNSGGASARKFYTMPDGPNGHQCQFGNLAESRATDFTTAPDKWGLYLNNNSSAYQGQLTCIHMVQT